MLVFRTIEILVRGEMTTRNKKILKTKKAPKKIRSFGFLEIFYERAYMLLSY